MFYARVLGVKEFYSSSTSNFNTLLLHIYGSLAAYALLRYWQCLEGTCNTVTSDTSTNNSVLIKKYAELVVRYITLADDMSSHHDYISLIKGFFELRQGVYI